MPQWRTYCGGICPVACGVVDVTRLISDACTVDVVLVVEGEAII